MNRQLIPLFTPSLVSLLLHNERAKGSALTKEEVIQIRNASQVIMSPIDVANEVNKERGYEDINPEKAWEEWSRIRVSFTQP